MKIRFLSLFLMGLFVSVGLSAQTKISGVLSCGKADPMHSIEVGDAAGHAMNLGNVHCTWSKPFEMAGVAVKDGYSVASSEMNAGKMTESGIHVGTMANGDKYTVRFQSTGTMASDHTGSVSGTWSFTGGTGKLKGLTGKGTYKGKSAADGTSVADVEGEYKTP